jgi:hypothetical protein
LAHCERILRGAGFVYAPPEKVWCQGSKGIFLLGSTYLLLAYRVVINGLTVENGIKKQNSTAVAL